MNDFYYGTVYTRLFVYTIPIKYIKTFSYISGKPDLNTKYQDIFYSIKRRNTHVKK